MNYKNSYFAPYHLIHIVSFPLLDPETDREGGERGEGDRCPAPRSRRPQEQVNADQALHGHQGMSSCCVQVLFDDYSYTYILSESLLSLTDLSADIKKQKCVNQKLSSATKTYSYKKKEKNIENNHEHESSSGRQLQTPHEHQGYTNRGPHSANPASYCK